MSTGDQNAVLSLADALPVDDLIGRIRAFIGRYEATYGTVPMAGEPEVGSLDPDERSDAELIAEAKRTLADIGAL